jgi:hypothetical protein
MHDVRCKRRQGRIYKSLLDHWFLFGSPIWKDYITRVCISYRDQSYKYGILAPAGLVSFIVKYCETETLLGDGYGHSRSRWELRTSRIQGNSWSQSPICITRVWTHIYSMICSTPAGWMRRGPDESLIIICQVIFLIQLINNPRSPIRAVWWGG